MDRDRNRDGGGEREREREKWLKILAQALQYFAVLETDFFQ